MSKLDPELFGQIRSICEHAGNLVQMGEDEFAISKYYEALNLVPDPKSDHSISTFVYTALGEQYFRLKDYGEAGKCFMKANKCPGGDTIGQISLRIGQCLEECGERRIAQDYLCQAYLMGGEELFASVSPKYYKIIRSEVEGTSPEDDEVDMLHEDDDYDLINSILRNGSSRSAGGDYSGYSNAAADRDISLYAREKGGFGSGQQRTGEDSVPDDDYYDDDWDGDDYFDGDPSDDDFAEGDYDDYDDDDFGGYDEESEDEDDEPVRKPRRSPIRKEDREDGEPGVWAKIVAAVKGFLDLFK